MSSKGCPQLDEPPCTVYSGSLDVEIPGDFLVLKNCSETCPKVVAYFPWVFAHLTPIVIHQTKPTTYDSYHAKWF